MASYVFDEALYLELNTDVADAVAVGIFDTGWEHYEKYGLKENRPVDFDEAQYLAMNPDVKAAVKAGSFASGKDHFIDYGRAEGRAPIFNNADYLEINPDVATAVDNGDFSSGLDHYVKYGRAEGRFTEFDEDAYLATYAKVKAAVDAGDFTSGLDHFIKYGKYDGHNPYPAVVNPDPDPDGETFTLTADQDNFTGASANDTFNAGAAQDGAGTLINTLQNVDVLDGDAGTDTLNFTEAEDKSVTPTLKNIENVNVRFVGTTSGGELDLSNATGVETVTVADSVDVGLVSELGAIANLNINNQNQDVNFDDSTAKTLNIGLDTVGKATGLVTVDLASASGTKASATTVNYTVNNAYVDMNAATDTTASTVTIDATGSNRLDLTDDAANATSVSVEGDGSVDLDAVPFIGALTTFNAADNSGGVEADIQSTAKVAVTGGSGDDIFRMDAAGVAVADSTVTLGAGNDALYVGAELGSFKSVDGGEGDADIINITDASTFTKANVANISNFEVLDVSGAGTTTTATTFDLSLKSFETVQIDEAVNGALVGNIKLDNVGADFTLKVMSAAGGGDFALGKDVEVALEDDTGEDDSVALDFSIFDGNEDNAANGNIVMGMTVSTVTSVTVTNTAGTGTTVTGVSVATVGGATAMTINGVETIDINANVGLLDGGSTGTEAADHGVAIGNLDADAVETINITGDASVILQSAGKISTLTTLDASGATGDVTFNAYAAGVAQSLTYLGSEGEDTVITSGHGDTLYTGMGADAVILDAGVARDTLVYKAASDSQIEDSSKDGKFTLGSDDGFDVITNFDFGGDATNDRLDVTNFGFAGAQRGVVDVSAKVTVTTDLSSVADFFDSAAGDRGIAFATDSTDGWLFIDANQDGNFTAADDMVVELAGVTTFSEVAVNF